MVRAQSFVKSESSSFHSDLDDHVAHRPSAAKKSSIGMRQSVQRFMSRRSSRKEERKVEATPKLGDLQGWLECVLKANSKFRWQTVFPPSIHNALVLHSTLSFLPSFLPSFLVSLFHYFFQSSTSSRRTSSGAFLMMTKNSSSCFRKLAWRRFWWTPELTSWRYRFMMLVF